MFRGPCWGRRGCTLDGRVSTLTAWSSLAESVYLPTWWSPVPKKAIVSHTLNRPQHEYTVLFRLTHCRTIHHVFCPIHCTGFKVFRPVCLPQRFGGAFPMMLRLSGRNIELGFRVPFFAGFVVLFRLLGRPKNVKPGPKLLKRA